MKKKNKTRKIKMKKLRCSPSAQKESKEKNKNFTCLSDDALYKLRDLWNARHPDSISRIDTNDSKEIWLKLQKNMNDTCNKESCWLKQKFVEGKLNNELNEAYAPESPKEWKKNPNDWLSSMDILNVMKQYEKAYKCFEFIGPSPIDYDTKKLYGTCVWEELCNFNLKNQIKSGKTKIGVIFNLDPHYKGGSHWVSLFINIKKKSIYYYDSVGEKIPQRIMNFVNSVIDQGKNMNPRIDFKFDQNYPVEHQNGNTECGVYSLYFIVHMLEDKITEHYLKTHILKDEYIEKFRKIYFNSDL
jgi:hypothetical protein